MLKITEFITQVDEVSPPSLSEQLKISLMKVVALKATILNMKCYQAEEIVNLWRQNQCQIESHNSREEELITRRKGGLAAAEAAYTAKLAVVEAAYMAKLFENEKIVTNLNEKIKKLERRDYMELVACPAVAAETIHSEKTTKSSRRYPLRYRGVVRGSSNKQMENSSISHINMMVEGTEQDGNAYSSSEEVSNKGESASWKRNREENNQTNGRPKRRYGV